MKTVRRRESKFIDDENINSLNQEEIKQIFLALSLQKESNAGHVIYHKYHQDMLNGMEIRLEGSTREGALYSIVKIMFRDDRNESGWTWATTIGPNFMKTFDIELKQIIRSRKLKELGI